MNVQVSFSFKRMTSKSIVAIVLFILVYILLVIFGIVLTGICIVAGIGIVYAKPMAITIGLGLGIASIGFFILVFLFKFLFKKHKTDLSHLSEITREQEPKLFSFIDEIVKEVETDFPKKIYVSSDVNASVFYDSSFWSMFLPIRKNLQIGIGLINTISEQEFKAILAHEFGHFSQRSMKVGSYVYNINQVIYNMLNDNESLDNMIQSWASASGYFSFFVFIAVRIIKGIQKILSKMYEYINISYMALSREMEFHADEIAANVAGYLPLKESLLRMDLADHSYNSVLSYYNNKIESNQKSNNIFKEQKFVMNFIANQNNIPIHNSLPQVSVFDLSKYNKSKLNLYNQWASHPSTQDRIKALENLNISKDLGQTRPAISLFYNPDNIEKQITESIFSKVNFSGAVSEINLDNFEKEYKENYFKDSFPKKYNCYYDNRDIVPFQFENLIVYETSLIFSDLYFKEKVDLVYESVALQNDKIQLQQIFEKEIIVKTFDYDGQKHPSYNAVILISQLEKEIEMVKKQIEENDINIYKFFLSAADRKNNVPLLNAKYACLFQLDKTYEVRLQFFNKFAKATEFINVIDHIPQINTNFKEIAELEKELIHEIEILLDNKLLNEDLPQELKDSLQRYTASFKEYFRNGSYLEDSLNLLFDTLRNFQYMNGRCYFLAKRDLLRFQIELLDA